MLGLAPRRYDPGDLEACLQVFDSNVPRFFRDEERPEYAMFLASLPGPYFVLVDDTEAVIACGGYAIAKGSGVADLCWGMVRREWHGRGAGRALAEHRIREVLADHSVQSIVLHTSQHTAGFYEHLGFETTRIEADGYASGLDRVDMRMGFKR